MNRVTSNIDWAVFVGYLITGATVSIWIGQDNNWDLRNYHIYNAYARIFDRGGYDIIPAQIQSFFNPLPDIWFLLIYGSMRPVFAGALIGAIHSLNYALIFMISKIALREFPVFTISVKKLSIDVSSSLIAILISLSALIAPTSLSILGTNVHDNLVSIPILASLLLLVKMVDQQEMIVKRTVLMAGFLAGLAFGLKMTASLYIAGTGLAILLFDQKLRQKLIAGSILTGGVIIGALVTGGEWFYTLWKDYGNPFFPWLNNFFRSPEVLNIAISDKRYLPENVLDGLLYPFYFAFNSDYAYSLGSFRDIRIAILYILGFYLIVKMVNTLMRSSTEYQKIPRVARFILIYISCSYVLWLIQFSIYRYLFIIESLSFLGIAIILIQVVPSPRRAALSFLSLLIITLAYGQFPRHDRLSWMPHPIMAAIPDLPDLESATVVLGGGRPSSFLIPGFPENTRFVRVGSNMHAYLTPESELLAKTEQVFRNRNKPVYLISGEIFLEKDQNQLDRYDLEIDTTLKWAIPNPHEPPLKMWRVNHK